MELIVKHSIFEPRKAYSVDKKSGEAKEVDYVAPTGPKKYDKYYIKRQVKYVPVPVSEGSEDYVLQVKVIDDLEDIQQVIETQAKGVGLQAMIEKFEKTGDISVLPQPVNPSDEVMDFTKLPQDNAEYFEYIHGLAAAYESLPIELRKDMSADEFIRQVTQKQVDDFIASKIVKEEKKDE